jgi:hypothetical protein
MGAEPFLAVDLNAQVEAAVAVRPPQSRAGSAFSADLPINSTYCESTSR